MASLDVWTLIGLLGAAQALVVGIALLTSSGLPRKVFGLLLLHLGAGMGAILYSHLFPGRHQVLITFTEITVAVLAPVLLYTFVLVATGLDWQRRLLVHALPAALWIAATAVTALIRGPVGIWFPPIRGIVGYQILYTALSVYRLIRADASRESASTVRWAWITVLFMAVIHVAQLVRSLVPTAAPRDIVPITSGLAVIGLTFVAARHALLFGSMSGEDGPPPKYRRSSLTDEQAGFGLARFLEAMEHDRVYLRTDLTLNQLATELGVARTHLSQLINERCHKPFLEVLADYRVEEAARILGDAKAGHLTAEAVGARAGFQSKSAFYSAFRKRYGEAPAAYRRRLQKATDEHHAAG